MPSPSLKIFSGAEALAAEVAGDWLQALNHRGSGSDPHTVGLSGGRVAVSLFGELRRQAAGSEHLLRQVHYFWADERCVRPESPESNFRTARERLFEPLEVPTDRIHRIRGEQGPDAAAQHAGQELRQVTLPGRGLDLILLGMGEDGHIASLFPGRQAEWDATALYIPVRHAPKPPPERVSLTLSAIAGAREIWVLVSGPGKGSILAEALVGSPVPLAALFRLRSDVKVFTDCDIKMQSRP